MVLAPALLALAEALDERVGEALEVARGLPDPRVLEDRRVERDDVVALLQHRPPPLGLDVALQQHAVVAVVVGRAEAAVDLRGGEDEAAPFAEGDDLLHRDLGRARPLARVAGHAGTVARCDNPAARADLRVQMRQRTRLRRDPEDERRGADRVPGVRRSAVRVLHPVAVHFKGSGFYNTDYGKKKKGGNGSERLEGVEGSERAPATRSPPSRSRATPSLRRLEAKGVDDRDWRLTYRLLGAKSAARASAVEQAVDGLAADRSGTSMLPPGPSPQPSVPAQRRRRGRCRRSRRRGSAAASSGSPCR